LGLSGLICFSYDVDYDDGDSEARKPPGEVRLIPRYKMGDKVEARYRGGTEWFAATIVGVTRANKYHLEYEDGQGEQDAPYSSIRRPLKCVVTPMCLR
jgi:hypothetical protein